MRGGAAARRPLVLWMRGPVAGLGAGIGNEFAPRDEVIGVNPMHRSDGDAVTIAKESLLLVGSGPTLELSWAAEAASYWPLSRAKRVRRVMGLPVLYVGDPFLPRRAKTTRVSPSHRARRKLLLHEPRLRPVQPLMARTNTGWSGR
jgi:hypothetical protein